MLLMMTLMQKKESREDPDAVQSTLIGVSVVFVFFSVFSLCYQPAVYLVFTFSTLFYGGALA